MRIRLKKQTIAPGLMPSSSELKKSKSKYPPKSVGRRMVREVPTARKGETVASVLRRIGRQSHELKTINYIYVVDKNERLVGIVSIKKLLSSPKKTKIERVMRKNLITVSPETDQEKAAHIALMHNIKALPVVKKGKFVGVLPSDTVFSITNKALQEDILHFAGISKSHLEFENTAEVPYLKGAFHRLPWLLVGLFGIILTAAFINFFDATLEKYMILAFFIPTMVYMSDAIGTQVQTLFIRDLAVMGNELNIGFYFLKHLSISFLISIIIGGIVFSIISLVWSQPYIGLVVSISMLASFMLASSTALLITLILKRLGSDPALGSGPFATVVSDMLTIVTYFFVATALLG